MSYNTLFAHQLESELEKQQFSILDMRDKNSFEREHIEGAELVNDSVISKLMREKQKDKPILIYCYHGNSSRDLASFFSGMGFSRVFNLEGGWQAWNSFIETNIRQPSDELSNWLLLHNFQINNINSRALNGMSALMMASLKGTASLLHELLKLDCDINLINNDGNNALWFACVSDNIEIIQALIERGINIDNVNINGSNALHYASSTGKYYVVKTLVEAGANLLQQTPDDMTALDMAASLSVLDYLKQKYIQH
jgi:ankyrin repeat protein